MSNSYIEGDIVESKDGGPKMHVLDIKRVGSKELISCFWFDESLNRQIHIATPETLVLVRKSIITPTQKLFRAVTKKDGVAKSYFHGNLWFRSHKWFRELEGEDNLEGVGTHRVRGTSGMNRDAFDEYPGQPAFFMSFSESVNGARSFDRGSDSHTLLEVQNPLKLRDEVIKKLLNKDFVMINWIKMEYGKTIEVDHELTPSEASERKYRQKPEEYRIEREWRLQIFFRHSFRTINDTLKFRWGPDIGNLFKYSREK